VTCVSESCVIACCCLLSLRFLLSAFCLLPSAFCLLPSASWPLRSLRTFGTLDAVSPSLSYSMEVPCSHRGFFLHLRLPTTSRLPARFIHWTTSACFQRNMPGTGLWSCSCLLAAPGGNFDLTEVGSMPKLRIKAGRWSGEVRCTCLVIVVRTSIPSVACVSACGAPRTFVPGSSEVHSLLFVSFPYIIELYDTLLSDLRETQIVTVETLDSQSATLVYTTLT